VEGTVITQEELAELKRLNALATPGPWRSPWHDQNPGNMISSEHPTALGGNAVVDIVEYDSEPHLGVLTEDADMICVSRNLMPKLLDGIEQLQAEVERLRAIAATHQLS